MESDRFEVRDLLGRGFFGTVYRAWDRDYSREVAMKVLHEAGPEASSLLKQEFRVLASIAHPNLVELHDLEVGDGTAFFTMELVAGSDICTWARGIDERERGEGLRRVAAQIARALETLHGAGILHRDIKPPNVLVDGSGAVRITDFGVATAANAVSPGTLYGTLDYLAPEVLRGARSGAPGDWYSLGVTLYEAWFGERPFGDNALQSAHEKSRGLNAAARARVESAGVPWLRILPRLLEPVAARRAGLTELLKALGEPDAAAVAEPEFVGRAVELETLQSALAAVTQSRRSALVIVEGPSGIGKSSLIRRFLADAPARGFVGRCHPHERIKMRALDGVVEALVTDAGRRPPESGASWPWIDEMDPALFRLFPAFLRLRQVDVADTTGSPRDQWLRAVRSLGRVFRGLSIDGPAVVWIDDVQWGDADSGELIRDLLRAGLESVLLILSRRDGASESGALLDRLDAPTLSDVSRHTIALGPLLQEESCQLGGSLGASAERVRDLHDLSGGNPYLLAELARLPEGDASSLHDFLAKRLQSMDPAERDLLELVATAGEPLTPVLLDGARDGGAHIHTHLNRLSKSRLVRVAFVDGAAMVSTYHDRIREGVLDLVEPGRGRLLHGSLADSLKRAGAEAARIVRHLLHAERRGEAGVLAVDAADAAAQSLSFGAAAEMYSLAIDLGAVARAPWQLRRDLAEAQANLGLGSQSAINFDLAATDRHAGAPLEGLALRQRAAEQFLRSGRVDEGRRLLQEVLRAVGTSLPAVGLHSVLVFIWRRILISRRGLDSRLVPADQASPEALLRLDALWTTTSTLSMVDHSQANAMGALHLLDALRIGEPRRLVQALVGEACFEAAIGGARNRQSAKELLARTAELAHGQATIYEQGWVANSTAIWHWFACDWYAAEDEFARAEAAFRLAPRGTDYEQVMLGGWRMAGLAMVGEIARLRSELRPRIDDAEARGDRFGINSYLAGQTNVLWLADDRPDLLRELADRTKVSWPESGFVTVQYHYLLSTTNADLYEGRAESAFERVEAAWPAIRKAQYQRLEFVGMELRFLRARAALAFVQFAVNDPQRRKAAKRAIKIAEQQLAEIRRVQLPPAAPWAKMVESGLAALAGRTDDARRCLADAEPLLAAARMSLDRAAVGWFLDERRPHAQAWFERQGVKRPDRLASVFVPVTIS